MMKKGISFLISLVMLFVGVGCTNSAPSSEDATISIPSKTRTEQLAINKQAGTGEEDQETPPSDSKTEQEPNMESKTLVVYFSATGTTKALAEYASKILSADIYEIVPEEPYTEADLAYYTNGRADQEQNDSSARPAISGSVENMEEYDTIVLGYPIWHGQAPRIINTYLESYDFSGKTIIPFCTSHSSGVGSSADNLHTLCSKQTNWKPGRRFEAGTSMEQIEEWLSNL